MCDPYMSGIYYLVNGLFSNQWGQFLDFLFCFQVGLLFRLVRDEWIGWWCYNSLLDNLNGHDFLCFSHVLVLCASVSRRVYTANVKMFYNTLKNITSSTHIYSLVQDPTCTPTSQSHQPPHMSFQSQPILQYNSVPSPFQEDQVNLNHIDHNEI